MSSSPHNSAGAYQPEDSIQVPPLYTWPPKPIAIARYLLVGLLFPWGYLFIALAAFSWRFLTPELASMAQWDWRWVGLIWLRNAALLTLLAGGLHWLLYRRRRQARDYKFNDRWPERRDTLFWFGNQTFDNIFWSVVSGVTIWTLYESATLWMIASGHRPLIGIAEHPVIFALMVLSVFFWNTAHFYFVHRLLHWRPLYQLAHELHHRNTSPCPWSGISMHPLEHVLYFSVFMLWWIVPVHPIVILLCGFFNGLGPAISHSGFAYLRIGAWRMPIGDWYHQLHHQYFHFNYGNVETPFDKLFGSWHDGGAQSLQAQKHRIRKMRAAR